METLTLKVSGMMCDGCTSGLKSALESKAGITSADADHQAGTCKISYNAAQVSQNDLAQWIEEAGFEMGESQP